MTHALRLVRERGHVDVPQMVFAALERQPASLRDRLECRFKAQARAERGRHVRDLDRVASKRG